MLATLVAAAVLHGTVTIGPTAPVCRVGAPCTRPAAGVVLRFSRGGHVVTARTDARGRYAVRLAAGTYRVGASVGMRISPFEVTVKTGRRLRSFSIDTGIR